MDNQHLDLLRAVREGNLKATTDILKNINDETIRGTITNALILAYFQKHTDIVKTIVTIQHEVIDFFLYIMVVLYKLLILYEIS